ncbi:hypothetical protein M728_004017 (plasmid) [Ensifer sp. WSM1721]
MTALQIALVAAAILASGYLMSSASAQSSGPWMFAGSDCGFGAFDASTRELITCRVGGDGSAICKKSSI